MTLSYETIFSKYRGNIDDPKELSMSQDDLIEIYVERLHNVFGDPRVIGKFESINLDDEIQEITFELKYSVNNFADNEFVATLLSLGMEIEWLKPKVDAMKFSIFSLGGKEEKVLQNNYPQLKDRLKQLELQFSNKLRSYGYINNSYLRGGS